MAATAPSCSRPPTWLFAGRAVGGRDTGRVEPKEHTELIEVVHAWDESMVANDSRTIGSFMTDEWIIVGPDGSIDGRERFLGLIASGDLTHETMSSEDLDLTGRGVQARSPARADRPDL